MKIVEFYKRNRFEIASIVSFISIATLLLDINSEEYPLYDNQMFVKGFITAILVIILLFSLKVVLKKRGWEL